VFDYTSIGKTSRKDGDSEGGDEHGAEQAGIMPASRSGAVVTIPYIE